MTRLAFIGFGEAGQAFAEGLGLPPGQARTFDLKLNMDAEGDAIRTACSGFNVEPASDTAGAVREAELVFSLVPTDQTMAAARDGAMHLKAGALWLDGSSSSPGRKREAAALIDEHGGHYVDMAIMSPVHPKLHRSPVLLSGAGAPDALHFLAGLNMNARVAGDEVGQASAIKMMRSVLIKGIEAVTAECLLAARRAGVEEAVLASFAASDPDVDWAARGRYNLERMTTHGQRRAAELREVVATLEELGLPSRMSAATAQWEEQLGALALPPDEQALPDRLDLILSRLK